MYEWNGREKYVCHKLREKPIKWKKGQNTGRRERKNSASVSFNIRGRTEVCSCH